jgi:hypothetical protein
MGIRGSVSHMRFVVCRFTGCDDDATVTVGALPLCALHRSYVLQLLDSGVALTSESASVITSDDWALISVGDLEI